MPQIEAVSQTEGVDPERNFKEILEVMVDADRQRRLAPADGHLGALQRAQFRAFNVHLEEIRLSVRLPVRLLVDRCGIDREIADALWVTVLGFEKAFYLVADAHLLVEDRHVGGGSVAKGSHCHLVIGPDWRFHETDALSETAVLREVHVEGFEIGRNKLERDDLARVANPVGEKQGRPAPQQAPQSKATSPSQGARIPCSDR